MITKYGRVAKIGVAGVVFFSALYGYLVYRWVNTSPIVSLLASIELPYTVDILRLKPPIPRHVFFIVFENMSIQEFDKRNFGSKTELYSFDQVLLSLSKNENTNEYRKFLSIVRTYIQEGYFGSTPGNYVEMDMIKNDDLKDILSTID